MLNERNELSMAEREGFEPPIPVKVCLISSQVHSTGLCHLSAFVYSNLRANSIVPFADQSMMKSTTLVYQGLPGFDNQNCHALTLDAHSKTGPNRHRLTLLYRGAVASIWLSIHS